MTRDGLPRHERAGLAAPVLIAFAALVQGACSDRMAGGSTEVGNSITLAGIVVTGDGARAVNSRVSLIPQSYNPALGDYLPAAWTTHTDSLGAYRIENAIPGVYNIEASDSAVGALSLIQSVRVPLLDGILVLEQPKTALAAPGEIRFPLEGLDRDAFLYIPGTRVMAAADSQARAEGSLVLDRVPAGRFPELIYYVPDQLSRNVLGREIEVLPGAGLVLDPYHGWRFLRKVTVNTTAGGALITENLVQVPLLLRLDNANFDFTQAKGDGEDLRITKADGKTPLPYEIEYWDALNQQAAVWVRLDTVYAGRAAEPFLLYSGYPEATGKSAGQAVFDTAAGFSGVWHLREHLRDATGFANDGTNHGSSPVPGLIGMARSFDGTSQYISVADHPSLNFGKGDFLASAFVQPAGFGNTAQVLSKRAANANYEIQLSRDAKATALIDTSNGAGSFNLYGKTTLKAGEWYHVALLRTGGKASLYLNGKLEAGPVDLPMNVSSESNLLFGADPMMPAGEEMFNGRLDEVQISRVARSADWIRFAYETQKAGSRVVTVGASR